MTGGLLDQLKLDVDSDFDVHRVSQANDPEKLVDEVGGDVEILCNTGHGLKIDGALMDRLPKLKLIANFGVGYDTIDAAEASRRNIIVTNTPEVLSDEVADTALGLLLMTVRELSAAERWLRDGKWASEGDYRLTPMSLQGRSIGIVGLGRIGKAIAHRCEAFGTPISYFGRTKKSDVAYPFYTDIVEMARAVDTLIVVTPGTAETKNLINQDVLEALGSDGVVINVARGSVVDENALITAINSQTIAGAGLDVMWNEPNINPELMKLENTVLLPHVGSASLRTRRAMGQLVIDNMKALKTGTAPLTPVPETPFAEW
ncbi:MAG: 2-hydroxyacid dehydrogenase [Pseudomonadota bacterium]